MPCVLEVRAGVWILMHCPHTLAKAEWASESLLALCLKSGRLQEAEEFFLLTHAA